MNDHNKSEFYPLTETEREGLMNVTGGWSQSVMDQYDSMYKFIQLQINHLRDEQMKTDPRIRHQFGDFRVVCPGGKVDSGGKFYANGKAVMEYRTKDSLGSDIWTKVCDFLPGGVTEDKGIYAIMCAGAADVK
jgi:hypothetical protein